MTNIQHPAKNTVPLAEGLAWGNDGYIYEQKLDGEFALREVASGTQTGVLAGEFMPRGFIAWDCVKFDGQDIRALPWHERAARRNDLCALVGFPVVMSLPNGSALLQAVLASGGEGIVRKSPYATYYVPMTACKRLQAWICRVTARANGQSVNIEDAATRENRGKVALRGGKCDRVRVGSLVKIEGLELHASGFIRDPRPCQDTPTSWLIQQ
jgi:hypothetical protein